MSTATDTVLLTLQGVDETSSVVDDIDNAFLQLTATLQDLILAAGELQGATSEMDSALTGVQTSVGTTEETIAGLNSTIGDLDTTASGVTSTVGSDFETLATTVSGAGADIETSLGLTDLAATGTSDSFAGLAMSGGEATGSLITNFEDVSGLVDEVTGTMDDDIGTLDDTTAAYGATVEDVTGTVLDSWNSQADAVSGATDATNSSTKEMSDNLENASKEMEGGGAGMADEFRIQLNSMITSIDRLNSTMAEMAKTSTGTSSEVEANAEKQAGIVREAAASQEGSLTAVKDASLTSGASQVKSAEEAAAAHEAAGTKTHHSALLQIAGFLGAASAMRSMWQGTMSLDASQTKIANAFGQTNAQVVPLMTNFTSLSYAGKYSADELSSAFANVAGSLKSYYGAALNVRSSTELMTQAQYGATTTVSNLGDYTGALAQIMEEFHVPITQSKMAMTVLTNTMGQTGESVGSLGSEMNRLGYAIGPLHIPLAQVGALIVGLAHQGITGGRGVMYVVNAIESLATPSQSQAELFARLGIKTTDASGKFLGLSTVLRNVAESVGKLAYSNVGATQAWDLQKIATQQATDAAQSNSIQANAQWKILNSVTAAIRQEVNAHGDAYREATAARDAQEALTLAQERSTLMTKRQTTEIMKREAVLQTDSAYLKAQALQLYSNTAIEQAFGRNAQLTMAVVNQGLPVLVRSTGEWVRNAQGGRVWVAGQKEIQSTFDQTTHKLGDFNTVAKAHEQVTHGLEYQWEALRNHLRTAGETIGLQLIPELISLTTHIADIVGPVLRFIGTHQQLENVIIGVGLAALGLGKYLKMTGRTWSDAWHGMRAAVGTVAGQIAGTVREMAAELDSSTLAMVDKQGEQIDRLIGEIDKLAASWQVQMDSIVKSTAGASEGVSTEEKIMADALFKLPVAADQVAEQLKLPFGEIKTEMDGIAAAAGGMAKNVQLAFFDIDKAAAQSAGAVGAAEGKIGAEAAGAVEEVGTAEGEIAADAAAADAAEAGMMAGPGGLALMGLLGLGGGLGGMSGIFGSGGGVDTSASPQESAVQWSAGMQYGGGTIVSEGFPQASLGGLVTKEGLVYVHAPEAIVPLDSAGGLSPLGGVGGGGGGDTYVTVEISGNYIMSQSDIDMLAAKIGPAIAKYLPRAGVRFSGN